MEKRVNNALKREREERRKMKLPPSMRDPAHPSTRRIRNTTIFNTMKRYTQSILPFSIGIRTSTSAGGSNENTSRTSRSMTFQQRRAQRQQERSVSQVERVRKIPRTVQRILTEWIPTFQPRYVHRIDQYIPHVENQIPTREIAPNQNQHTNQLTNSTGNDSGNTFCECRVENNSDTTINLEVDGSNEKIFDSTESMENFEYELSIMNDNDEQCVTSFDNTVHNKVPHLPWS